jgi:hypothetical protein
MECVYAGCLHNKKHDYGFETSLMMMKSKRKVASSNFGFHNQLKTYEKETQESNKSRSIMSN